MKKFSILLFVLSISIHCFTQSDTCCIIDFQVNSHDFGTLKKYTGDVKYNFDFTNKGSSPIIIRHIETDCECTTTSWSSEPVLPGKSASVTVFINPDNVNGKFKKKIQVNSNADNSTIELYVSGFVEPSDEKDVYQHEIDNLSLKSKHINIGILRKGEVRTKSMDIFNNSDIPMSLDFSDVPEYIKIEAKPKVIEPGEKGCIFVEYHSELVHDWDNVMDRVMVVKNGNKNPENKLAITSNIVEDFSRMTTEQFQLSPTANYILPTKQFDTITTKKTVECKFLVRNEGKTDLIVRDVNPSCGCTAVKPEKNVVSPGDSTYIFATFDPKERVGDFNYSITVITNDPKNNRQYLWIKGFVKN